MATGVGAGLPEGVRLTPPIRMLIMDLALQARGAG
jgi:hypothetical protein